MGRYFYDLPLKELADTTVIVDVDGTMLSDGGTQLHPNARAVLAGLAERSRVYLCSNTQTAERLEVLAAGTAAHVIRSRFKKPNARVLEGLDAGRMVVIGDKYLTDGLLAARVGARFIKARTIRDGKERTFVRITYLLDALIGLLAFSCMVLYGRVRPFVELARPKQWLKNILVFAPAFFAGTAFAPEVFARVALATVAFSFLASAVYAGNDIWDREDDARHPIKRRRPLPSGRLSVRSASGLAVVLAIAAFLTARAVPGFTPILVVYLLVNVAYSFALKRVAILDAVVVASLYMLRVVAGTIAAAVAFSPWIVIATFFLALFLVAGKRRSELCRDNGERRKVLDGYTKETLDGLLIGSATLSLCAYGLWSVLAYPSPLGVYSIIPVSAVVFLALNLFYRNPDAGEAPELMVFRDRWILALTASWGLWMFALLYIS